ncbi:MAG: helix-turn-helix transcriptional regulator [Deltaproteobacteria bacterium]|jgi:ArsR family transcriptional regulator, lead/cadmium/zinc/bismuth-responsive transcriptional repressor|nr:helix-turn-helix transcriptional regulator [Deltaproteobacteria bacterium]MBT4090119.1 helix-turn-helix transcriptional regulator [Deltaproteobacteria bacterium]MBT4262654.1 helix-turn-helix transcriptional regulator [Deltaproteobacteria bacterium]MBT4643199.1 helix-turn-helix transcriptional regulator [Deltaproteobacteria bacterium]MBT6502408.1 helix-turn-helix transcriptional regulator [Deltaproteobacteria bacterium]
MTTQLEPDICEDVCIHEQLVEKVKKELPRAEQMMELSNLFKALGDFTRIRILEALLSSELCVCDLVSVLDMNQSAVSHQLRVLRSSKIVKFRKEGKNVYYSLDDNHISQLINQGLNHVLESR